MNKRMVKLLNGYIHCIAVITIW